MTPRVADMLERLHAAERDLWQDLVDQADRWRFRLDRQTPRFAADVARAHRSHRPSWLAFLKGAQPLFLLTAPVIYSVALPLLVVDIWMSLYQWLCFPVYGIPYVRRRDYFIIDHQRLGYLNAVEKVHCMYCGYANGLIGYIREIAARTEQYWCPIKHGQPIAAPHSRYHLFADYGDAEGYRRDLETLRQAVQHEDEPSRPSTTKTVE